MEPRTAKLRGTLGMDADAEPPGTPSWLSSAAAEVGMLDSEPARKTVFIVGPANEQLGVIKVAEGLQLGAKQPFLSCAFRAFKRSARLTFCEKGNGH